MLALVPAPRPTSALAGVARPRTGTKLAAAALVALLGLGVPGVSDARRRPRATTGESSMRALINQERLDGAGRQLRMRPALIRIARRHSRRMASAGSIYHNPNLGRALRRLRWRIAGENVGVGGEVPGLHQAFMQSPSHRENILRPQFGSVGIGTVYARDRLWVTVVFIG